MINKENFKPDFRILSFDFGFVTFVVKFRAIRKLGSHKTWAKRSASSTI